MSLLYGDALAHAQEYARRRRLNIEKQLGGGVDGVVLSTSQKTAIKALRYKESYEQERDAYLRLKENGIEKLKGFAIPRHINHHDELLIVEMQIVSPPFVVDFASAKLDAPHDFPEETYEEWESQRIEMFGLKRWDEVCSLLSALRRYGIHLLDAKPGNVTFAEEDEGD